jgi:hypothetical protein
MGERDPDEDGMHDGFLIHKTPRTRIPRPRANRRDLVVEVAVVIPRRALLGLLSFALLPAALPAACVPPGNSTPSDAGSTVTPNAAPSPTFRPSTNVLTTVFEDNFDRPSSSPTSSAAVVLERSPEGGAFESPSLVAPSNLGPAWTQAGPEAWRIENGRLCGKNAKNRGVWLQRTLPVNARIEFDAISDAEDGDLKCEVWGDGRSGATGISYTNATSYLAIFGGWHNTFHVLARMNEHGPDRKEIKIDKTSDDPTEKPVTAGQLYHFKIERTDGKTVHWSVNGVEYLAYTDPQPLVGAGHDHFGFNDWETKVCFDNVKVTPLP